jgi:hypothetical protein
MSTRGFIGFVVDGTEKITYNHFDSYPSGLGTTVLDWLRKEHRGHVQRKAGELRVVAADSTPTAEDIERLRGYANLNVGEQTVESWYVLLRETQGNPAAILDAGVLIDGSSFPLDSVFAEYGYLVDLDSNTFEAYRGFQKEEHDKGRFADREPFVPEWRKDQPVEYWPCALVASWPLDALPTDDEFCVAIDGPADEDDDVPVSTLDGGQ